MEVVDQMKKFFKRGWPTPAFDHSIPGGDGLLERWCTGGKRRERAILGKEIWEPKAEAD